MDVAELLEYGNQDTAYYNLEMLASATIDRIVSKQIVSEDDIGGFRDSMDKIVLDSNKVYRKLVFETPAFLDYFLQATPIKQISNLNIGSRPAARKKITDFSCFQVGMVLDLPSNILSMPILTT